MAEGTKEVRRKVTFYYRHFWKNILLLALSVFCAPFSAAICIISVAATKLHGQRNITFSREDKKHGAAVQQRKTILVTGVSMTKGLAIARNLSQHTPHRIIGADISALSPGRFSNAIVKYYRLDTPSGDDAEPYIDSILHVIHSEKVNLWISCSSVVAAVEDGQVVRFAEKQAQTEGRRFEAIQFREDVVEKFHEKDKFIEYIESLDLTVPDSHRCTNPQEALDVLMRELHRTPTKANSTSSRTTKSSPRKQFIMKPIGVDDKARNNMMTLLPFQTTEATTKYIRSLGISKTNPFQLQQFIKGKEYCTHALVVKGKVTAFTSCPSLELLMHYEPLPPTSQLSKEMLNFTERVCADGGETFTGHLSFDFLVEDEKDVKLYPIECNPRAHTAVVLFEQTPEMADAYLSIFNKSSSSSRKSPPVSPKQPTYSYYWLGHDLVSFGILPIADMLFGHGSRDDVVMGLLALWRHWIYWKDGTFTLEDPWPFFALYHVYWPMKFLESLRTGRAWSRINVSTTKMFLD
ncbi:hypothetical protein T440DRAFT_441577 [Plenodomus tracheiphilus IPT5]|uniref:ATP-grasp domain-containing protein n=1 Tax=Plenodomus tracheiphilus IPT5 TaxID=1408161 RepID=A0A6A7BK74_9PLEO|nr:hypothetical protein T440DRAFT_441577 [Plenodomus tracheiphilus IPT5]